MTKDALYDLAFRYKKTKLWTHTFDTQVFAVRTDQNKMIFVCIMGRIAEHIAVSVYPEDEFYSYYHFLDADPEFGIVLTPDMFERLISSSCIQCSFENKDMLDSPDLDEARAYAKSHGIRIAGKNAYPKFTRFKPYHYPWSVDEEHDLDLLAAGLEAAIALSDALKSNSDFHAQFSQVDARTGRDVPVLAHTPQGYQIAGTTALPPRRDASYPSGNYSNEVLLRKIQAKKRGKGAIDCRIIWLNNPVQDNPGDAPYYPAALIAVEESDGKVMSLSVTRDYESGHDELLSEFMAALSERKMRPAKILAQSDRTFALLTDTMQKVSIDLDLKSDLPLLDDAILALYNHMDAAEPDDAPDDFSQMESDLSMMLSEMEAMGDGLLKYVPEDIIDSLSELSSVPELPSTLKKRIDSLLNRIDGITPGVPASSNRAGDRRSTGGGGKSAASGSKKRNGQKTGKGRNRTEEPLSYVISVSPYTGCYRHIRVSADITLDELHNIIQDVFAFNNDHLYAFFMDNKAWSHWDAYFSPHEGEERSAADYRLRDLALYKGQKFLYLFDFGDEWRFECRILRAVTEDTNDYRILRSKGEAPEQYPDYFGDDDEYDDDEYDEEDDLFW